MKSLVLALVFAISSFSSFSVDKFNTYRWNRKNEIRKNGKVKKTPWFEWWYYKVVIPETKESFFFVYGVVNPWDTEHVLKGSRAAIGFGDFTQKYQIEKDLPVKDFNSSYSRTYVEVGNNWATDTYLKGDIQNENGDKASWNISMKRKWTYNATSWATGKMITNIEWYPAQADATCSGEVFSNGKLHKFTNAPCYQDRNWGKSFPKWWTWIVSNHFKGHPDTALAIGGGKPKFLNKYDPLESVSIGLRHKGVDYTFRPNEFNDVKININFGTWEVTGINKNVKIEVSAYAPKEDFMDLQFMTPQGEVFHDYETLTGKVTVKLYKKKSKFSKKWKLIETLTSDFAGIEYGSFEKYSLQSFYNTNFSLF